MAHQRKVIIFGKTGTGKSSLGNTLLGTREFPTGFGPNAVTETCIDKQDENLLVIDTPGLFSAGKNIARCALQIQAAIDICARPHAFLVVYRLDRLTEEELLTFEFLKLTFGPNCLEHTIIVFTNVTNDMEDAEFMAYCNANNHLKNIVETCGNRVARIENTERYDKTRDISRIFSFVDEVSDTGRRTFELRDIEMYVKVLQKRAASFENENFHDQLQMITEDLQKEVKMKKLKIFLQGAAFLAAPLILCYINRTGRIPTVSAATLPYGRPAKHRQSFSAPYAPYESIVSLLIQMALGLKKKKIGEQNIGPQTNANILPYVAAFMALLKTSNVPTAK